MKDVILPRHLDRLTTFLLCHGDKYFVGSEVFMINEYISYVSVFGTYVSMNNDVSNVIG